MLICENPRQKKGLQMNVDKLKHKEVTDIVLKSFYDVYNELGHGFLESIYEKAMCIVLEQNGIGVESQKEISVYFQGQVIGNFRADIVVNDLIILELKAVHQIAPTHEAQLINYLKATSIEVGMLLNFGEKPTFKRMAFDNQRKNPRPNTHKNILAADKRR